MNKIFLIAGFLSFNLMAAEVQFGRIVDLKGEGFISYNGKTREIRNGDAIEMGAEIVIEHRGQVSFTDNADHRYHLGNSSSARVSGKSVELRSGDLWFQSLNKNDTYKIKTANAMVEYQGGEAILSYDSVKGKSQLMVINGMMKLSNLRASELNLSVAEGHFSFIDNAYDEGAPRDPTPVGEKTFGQLVSLFSGVAPMDKNSAAIFKEHDKKEQEVAHAPEHAKVEPTRAIASVDSNIIEEYKNSMLQKKKSKNFVTNKKSTTKVEKSKATALKMVVHVYGKTSKPTVGYAFEAAPDKTVMSRSRAPASVLEQEVPKDSVNEEKASSPAIASPYSKEYKNQYKESDKLIDDLKKL